jgi:hypothetical protein
MTISSSIVIASGNWHSKRPRLYRRKLGLSNRDLHVAGAVELKAEPFWTFDERQAKLAQAQALKTSES